MRYRERTRKPKNGDGRHRVVIKHLTVINEALTPPITIDNDIVAGESKTQYRYLDLRRPVMQRLVYDTNSWLRNYLSVRNLRDRNTHPHQANTRRSTRLRRTITSKPRKVLCITTKPTIIQTNTHGRRT